MLWHRSFFSSLFWKLFNNMECYNYVKVCTCISFHPQNILFLFVVHVLTSSWLEKERLTWNLFGLSQLLKQVEKAIILSKHVGWRKQRECKVIGLFWFESGLYTCWWKRGEMVDSLPKQQQQQHQYLASWKMKFTANHLCFHWMYLQ